MKIKKKRPILLLEVLVALTLVALCLVPLIYPHIEAHKSQKQYQREVEIDHAINLWFAQFYEDLYSNKITWEEISSDNHFPLSEEVIKEEGSYYFNINKTKKNKKEEAHLVDLHIQVKPKWKKALEYHYNLFVVRELGGNSDAHQTK